MSRKGLVEDQPDFSAESVAAARAFSCLQDPVPLRNPDHLARHFLGPAYRFACRVRPVGRLAYGLWQLTIPGIAGYLNARTHHIDEVVRTEAAGGARQVVVLGAGYDTRAWRLAQDLGGGRLFEVDRSGTQRRKARLAATRLGPAGAGHTLVAFDFEGPGSLFENLKAAGYDPAERTLFVWEGVSYYLSPGEAETLLDQVAGHAADGSAIVFDYLYAGVLHGDRTHHGAQAARRFLARRGQPYRFGIPEGDSARYLGGHGYRLVHDLSPHEMWRRYLSGAPGSSADKIFGGYGMALARVTKERSA